MSVGRRICHTLVDTAADLRWYAAALTEANEDLAAAADCLEIASRAETLIPRILAFEGENFAALPAGVIE